jgi:hypothetical protein
MVTEGGKGMSYTNWLQSIIDQIRAYGLTKETDLVLLRNHLTMLVDDIERTPEFKLQLSKCTD